MDFTGKIALVTGSSSGIGAAIAKELAAGGACVALNYRGNQAGADATAAAICDAGGECASFQADVSSFDEASELVKVVEKELGRVNILVNNAGTTRDALLMSMKEEGWRAVIGTNLDSIFHVTRATLRGMIRQRWGRIINISSIVGLAGKAGQTNYAASKAGMIGLSKSLAREVGSRGITVNVVAPGFVPTALTDVMSDEQKEQTIAKTPLGRFGDPEDIAWAVAFLASERAGFITGQVLSVDGGLVMM
jgi:3-oxoacyl-[acyl-carrier protein] reductase